MPHASVVRSQSGMSLALVAVIVGGALSTLLLAGWIYAMVDLNTFGSPGILTLLAVFAVQYGAFRLAAERRIDALVARFPQAFTLHVIMSAAQRRQFRSFAIDAGIDASIPVLGGRFAVVATPDWVRIYRGLGDPRVVIEVPAGLVAEVNFVTKKTFLVTQSVLSFQLIGPTQTWPAEVSAVFFRTVTAAPIPVPFYAEELAAMTGVMNPAPR